MPLDTNLSFRQESRKRETQPIFLYTVYDYKGTGENLYYAGYDTNVTFDGIEYLKFPISHSDITENVKGEIDNVKVQISNISRLIEAYLQNYDLRGKKASIKMVWANKLDDPDCYIEFSNHIDSYTSNVSDVVFNLLSKFDILNVTIPGMVYLREYCQWLFRGEECSYAGAETSCNKTWQRCKELENSKRFIGFRSIPGRRGFV